MERREIALVEIYNRLYADRVALGLNFCKRMPCKPIQPDLKSVPGLYMIEGEDHIVERNSRHPFGYPARRSMEVILEILCDIEGDAKTLYSAVRKSVLGESVRVADDSFINELRTEGPASYEIPDLQGIRLILVLSYVDDGI